MGKVVSAVVISVSGQSDVSELSIIVVAVVVDELLVSFGVEFKGGVVVSGSVD